MPGPRADHFSHKTMHPIWHLAAVLLPLSLAAQVQIDPPVGWIELETPSQLPPEILYLRKIAPEDESMQVTVVAMKPVDSLSGADDFVSGQINGMKKGGFILESVNEAEVNGFPARHVVGEVRSDQFEGAYLADTMIIFSDSAVVSVSVMVDDAFGGRELGEGVLEWISIPGTPAVLSDRGISPSKSFSVGETVGRLMVYAAAGAALIGIIRRRIQSGRPSKDSKIG